MARLAHSARAREDLIDIWVTIAADNPAAADRVFARLEMRIKMLIDWPFVGRACPEIAPEARMLVERPYVVLYQVMDDVVQIVRVVHGARDIDEAMFGAGVD